MGETPKVAEEATPVELGTGSAETATPLEGEKGQYDLRSQKTDGGGGDDSSGDSTEDKAEEESEEEAEVHYIKIVLKNDQGTPVPVMPSGDSVKFHLKVGTELFEGELDEKGEARVDGITETECEVSFPQIDGDEIKKK